MDHCLWIKAENEVITSEKWHNEWSSRRFWLLYFSVVIVCNVCVISLDGKDIKHRSIIIFLVKFMTRQTSEISFLVKKYPHMFSLLLHQFLVLFQNRLNRFINNKISNNISNLILLEENWLFRGIKDVLNLFRFLGSFFHLVLLFPALITYEVKVRERGGGLVSLRSL